MQNRVAVEFQRLLGMALDVSPYTETRGFSFLINNIYNFFLCKADERAFLLMCLKEKGQYTPGRVAVHMTQVQKISGLPVVFATETMAAYKRRRFLEKHIPFIVPGKQAYIPFFGAFLTAGGAQSEKHFDELGNLAQILVLARIQQKFTMPLSIAEAIKLFSYSRISVMRAFDELEFFQLAQRNPQSRHLEFPVSGKALWEKALPLLKNPCRKCIGVERIPKDFLCFPASIYALSERSMLSSDAQLQFAVEAKKLNKKALPGRCSKEDAPFLLELWQYPPNVIGGNAIDSLSLYLTLQNDPDERVQIALDEMLKGLPW